MSNDNPNNPAPAPGATSPPPPSPLFVPRNTGLATIGRAAKPDIAKVVSLAFTSDHGKLKDNDADWKNTGALFADPEFTFGKPSKPISQSRDTAVAITVEIELYPLHLEERTYTIQGAATWGRLTFATTQPLKGGKQTVKLASNEKLPDKITRLEGDIEWSIVHAAVGSIQADHSFGHVIFVTMGTPEDDRASTLQEDGLTIKRMQAAIDWVAPLDTLRPHAIVAGIMGKIDRYTLTENPAVPAQFEHPTYLGNAEGGAWPLYEYAKYYGECQAICRLTRAMLRQLGIPGKAIITVVWAEPIGGKAVTKEADWEASPTSGLNVTRQVNGRVHRAALVDGAVIVGKKYSRSHTSMPDGSVSPGLNRYEACLHFDADGETKYYGGGAGVFASKDGVIRAFWGLVWCEIQGDGGYIVREIVKVY
ncbi:MAG TPA: hypothetical protein VK550_16400 [Polyangiaceae bacterium]|nr:hypothetical protein [Polyangiaceae bacterium]